MKRNYTEACFWCLPHWVWQVVRKKIKTGSGRGGNGDRESARIFFLQAEEEKYEYVMPEVYSEDATFDALADFLAAYYQIPEEELEETRYYYNYVDLNEDGTKEIIALTVGETTSTSMGECVLVLSQEGTDFTVISDLRNVRTPVVISDELTDGWHDLIYYVYGGGQEAGYLKCHYMGADGYQSTEEISCQISLELQEKKFWRTIS